MNLLATVRNVTLEQIIITVFFSMRVTLLELFLLRSGMINGNAVGDKMIE